MQGDERWKEYAVYYDDWRMYAMTDDERDALLIRLDERVHETRADVKEIKTDVKEQNGKVSKLSNRVYWLYGILSAMGITGGLGIAGVFG